MTIETAAPEWPEDADEDAETMDHEYQVVSIRGDYQDYLEGRLPPFVQRQPHFAGKGLTTVELDPLVQTLGVVSKSKCPLFNPPSVNKMLEELPEGVATKLASLDEQAQQRVAAAWAAAMSTPEHTHTVSGKRISDGWLAADAIQILQPLADLARQMEYGHRMYLLVEA